MTIWEAVFGAQSADENDAFDKAYPQPLLASTTSQMIETEEQKQERLWKAIQEMSRG